jgi:hypothetical protein
MTWPEATYKILDSLFGCAVIAMFIFVIASLLGVKWPWQKK